MSSNEINILLGKDKIDLQIKKKKHLPFYYFKYKKMEVNSFHVTSIHCRTVFMS